MIIAIDRATYISVQRAEFKPTLSVEHLGEIRRVPGRWYMKFTGRNWNYYTDLLNGSEKAQIIRLLDKLNGVLELEISDLEKKWNQIIGRLEDDSYRN